MPSFSATGILLAAGAGRRFDPSGARNKLTEPLGNGVSVAGQSAQQLRLALDHVLIVVANSAMAVQLATPGCQVLVCPVASQGMGATLAFAVAHVRAQQPHCSALLVALADMPFVQPATLHRLLAALASGADIVQPVVGQQGGNPVGFAARHFAALSALQGDIGARHLLRQFPVERIEVDDPGIFRDIDCVDDLI